MERKIDMVEHRRNLLEQALSTLPFDEKFISFTKEQKQVIEIIDKMKKRGNNASSDTIASLIEEDNIEKQINAEIIPLDSWIAQNNDTRAQEALECIEAAVMDKDLFNHLGLCTLSSDRKVELLMEATAELGKMRSRMNRRLATSPTERQSQLDHSELDELLEKKLKAELEARLKLVKSWERIKRTALDLLTTEVAKLQARESQLLQMENERQLYEAEDDDEDDKDDKGDEDEDYDEFYEGSYPEKFEETDGSNETDDANSVNQDSKDSVEIKTENGAECIISPTASTAKRSRSSRSSSDSYESNSSEIDLNLLKSSVENELFELDEQSDSEMIVIGPNGTEIPRFAYKRLNWLQSGPSITRKVLCEVFDRTTLAFHTLTGKPSPAFRGCLKPKKAQLDPLKVADIVYLMTTKMSMAPREVRSAITTKCADENKMMRTREAREINKLKPRTT